MSAIDPLPLLEPAATRVRDPVSGRSVWLARLVRDARVDAGVLTIDMVYGPQHNDAHRQGIGAALVENLRGLGWEGEVVLRVGEETPEPTPKEDPVKGMSGGGVMPHGGPVVEQEIEGVKHVVVVSSAKGGVGKSTIATNLAVALSQLGHPTGLMDADLYGPSVPRMMNVTNAPMVDDDQHIIPPSSYGVRCLSVGMLVPEEEAVIWRGPLVMNVLRQFLQQTQWGELDYLVVDLPPGTGDAQLTLVQGCKVAGAIVVTTPQEVALADAVRGIIMFDKLDVPVLGLVENMSWYELPDGRRDHVFGEDGGKRLALRHQLDLLGQIPLQTSLRKSGDEGLPAALGDDAIALAFKDLAMRVVEKLPVTTP
ncbi:MAG: Mrp/NBP35 family ATP-binding protein [Deltaproteobacteria bacterium]|nr:Mrp/NBP35 family ATP-binding protein [Deltaproteobacteria bacterium]